MHQSVKLLVLMISVLLFAVACGEPETKKTDSDGPGHEHSHDGHDHDGDGHSHGKEGDGDAGTDAPVNAMCPIMVDNKAGTKYSADFAGKKVGFCCSKCITAWDKLSDDEKTAKLKQ